MAVMDEFKEERARMKQQPLKKRLEYFWDYHKYHVLAGGFVLFFVVDMIYSQGYRLHGNSIKQCS